LLLVGVLAGVTVGGGVGVIAASSTKSVTVCANKKTNMLRYAKNNKCVTKTEKKVELNQTGSDGITGAAGAKGEAGTNGTNGAAGAKGEAGTNGTNGAAGAKGDTGAAGSSFTARSVCGLDGMTLCAVGVQGPGGGKVFYVDTEGRYSEFDYLEVASEDASTSAVWSTTTPKCGTAALLTSCTVTFVSTSGEALNLEAIGTGRAATAAIIARHDAGTPVDKNDYAAGIADRYTTTTASDWFLPSEDELNEVCKYAANTGQAAGASTVCSGGTLRSGFAPNAAYFSSSEFGPDRALAREFTYGTSYALEKSTTFYVRPVRAF
jgi:hypothetical protein